jgi:hypothetical protein
MADFSVSRFGTKHPSERLALDRAYRLRPAIRLAVRTGVRGQALRQWRNRDRRLADSQYNTARALALEQDVFQRLSSLVQLSFECQSEPDSCR